MTLSPDPSYVDLSSLVESWEEVRTLLRPHVLNPLKPSLIDYSVINEPVLKPSLTALNAELNVYTFDPSKKLFLAHHGVCDRVMQLLDIPEQYDTFRLLKTQAWKMGKSPRPGMIALMRAADKAVFDYSEDYRTEESTISDEMIRESYQEYLDLRHADCHISQDCTTHGFDFAEYKAETIGNLLLSLSNVISTELEIYGEVPMWKTVV